MSLEVDARPRGVPVASQREDEGFKYLNEQSTHGYRGQIPYGVLPDARHLETQISMPTPRSHEKKITVPSRFVVFWSIMFCLVSVLAVVAAGVAGSIAVRRERDLSTWYFLLLRACLKSTSADSPITV